MRSGVDCGYADGALRKQAINPSMQRGKDGFFRIDHSIGALNVLLSEQAVLTRS
jgi:hypothetical protein